MKSIFSILITASFCLTLSGCLTQSRRQQSWMNPQFNNYKMGKTAVLAIADSKTRCLQYESLFADSLKPFIAVTPLHETMGFEQDINEKSLDALLRKEGIKNIVITTVIDGSQVESLVVSGYSATPYDMGYWGYWGYWGYGYTLTPNLNLVSTSVEYTLETSVYDVASKKIVWSGRKSVVDSRSNMHNMKIIISNVVHDLEKRGLLN